MTKRQIDTIARRHGAWYERGAWRFPTVAAKIACEREIADLLATAPPVLVPPINPNAPKRMVVA